MYSHLKKHRTIRDGLCEKITKMIDEGRTVDVGHMDIGKQFDKVSHGRLLQSIKSHGIHHELVNWIQRCLGNKRLMVVEPSLTADYFLK